MNNLKLINGSKVAIVGGGPAGSFAGYYFLKMASQVDLDIQVDIFEPKDYTNFGPTGCNHCAGIISESLVQILAAEGINIPSKIIRRGINAYVLHMDSGSVRINTPSLEKRIVAMFRGAGPKSNLEVKWGSFDGFLQQLTKKAGTRVIHDWVKHIGINSEGYPVITSQNGMEKSYDLLVGAGGVKGYFFNLFKNLNIGFKAPTLTRASICEFPLEREKIHTYFGDALHVFLLDIPRLKFASLIPKDGFVTLVLLGEKIDKNLLNSFLNSTVVKNCFPPDWDLTKMYSCQCAPSINILSATKPFSDRIVLIGDSATTKLYKNGIGAAYITAKAAATTAILQGISSQHFEKYYWPVCKSIKDDNAIGKKIFSLIGIIQKKKFIKRAVINMVHKENQNKSSSKSMSMVLWDTFTGNASYREILGRMLRPALFLTLLGQIPSAFLAGKKKHTVFDKHTVTELGIGKIYQDGELIIKQGEKANCMYVIQFGKVAIILEEDGHETHLATLDEGDFFGEMSLFAKEARSTTVKAVGKVQVITIDKKTFLQRIHVDPSFAFSMLKKMSFRIRDLNQKVTQLD